jgi:uncharacterized membrane protein required for colicin V production
MPHIKFNWVDILFITLLIRIGYIGLRKGLFSEALRFSGLMSAFILSFNNYTLLSLFLSRHMKWTGAKPEIISFLLIFLGVLLVFKVFSVVAGLFFNGDNLSAFNRLAGFVLSLGRGILLISLVYTLFVNSSFKYIEESAEEKSFSGKYVEKISYFVYQAGMKFYPWKKIETPLTGLLKK